MPAAKEALTACPKCGGTTGYETTLVMTHTMGGGWGARWESGEDHCTRYPKTVRCADCNRRVPLLAATGGTCGIEEAAE